MNDNLNNQVNINNMPKCPNCGAVITDPKAENCIRCGYMFRETSTVYKDNNIETKSGSKKGIILMVLSIINCIFILPALTVFMGLFSLFAPFGSVPDSGYSLTLLLGSGYEIASIIGLIAFIINAILKGTKTKACLVVVCISFCLGMIYPVVIQKLNIGSPKSTMKQTEFEENKIVYQENNLVVTLTKINYEKYTIDVYFDFETPNLDDYNLMSDTDNRSIRVNNCFIPAAAFKKINAGNSYKIEIKYSDLKFYKIDELYTIDFEVYNKPENKHIQIKMPIKEQNLAIITDKVLNGYEMIYKNEYFELYMDQNINWNYLDLYVKSLVPDDYYLYFNNVDFDKPGYAYKIFWGTRLQDYSIIHDRIDFDSCKSGLKYAKFDYKISGDKSTVKEESVEVELKNIKCFSD